MEISALREFVCLAKTLNFTAAAKQCYISQSVLSKHIGNLENEIGTSLFIRTRQRVQLTPAGRQFAADMEKTLELFDDSLKKIERDQANNGGVLKIAFLAGATQSFLHEACHNFNAKNGNVELVLYTMEGSALFKALDDDDVDVIISMVLGEIDTNQYDAHKIYDDFYGAVVPKEMAETAHDRLRKEDLAGMSIAIPDRRRFREEWFFLKHHLESLIPDARILDIVNNAADFNILPASGKCIVMVPNHMTYSLDTRRLKFVPLDAPQLNTSVKAIWKRENDNPMIRSFIDSIETTLSEQDGESLA